MSAGIQEVVKIVAPIALDALIQAATALIAGPVFDDKRKHKRKGLGDPAETMVEDLNTYITTNFATSYGYYWNGTQSQPVAPSGKSAFVSAATTDIVVWDPTTGVSSIQSYMQSILSGSIPPSDSIAISANLATIFTERFAEESLEWTPLMKRFNQPDGLIADVYMVTSAAVDASGNRAGIASYCFVAYKIQ
jgi:hypothetical protein